MPLHPSLRGLFSTISLTADGSLWGVGENKHYSLISDSPTSTADVTQDATFAGAVTVRSAAYFSVVSNPENATQAVLSITNVSDGMPIQYNLGQLDGRNTFLDVNQGMEPYVLVEQDTGSEVRRYSIQGHLLCTLSLDQQHCRPMARSIYVDRPGDVYVMCVNDSGAMITRYAMTDDGHALPLFEQLVTTAHGLQPVYKHPLADDGCACRGRAYTAGSGDSARAFPFCRRNVCRRAAVSSF